MSSWFYRREISACEDAKVRCQQAIMNLEQRISNLHTLKSKVINADAEVKSDLNERKTRAGNISSSGFHVNSKTSLTYCDGMNSALGDWPVTSANNAYTDSANSIEAEIANLNAQIEMQQGEIGRLQASITSLTSSYNSAVAAESLAANKKAK